MCKGSLRIAGNLADNVEVEVEDAVKAKNPNNLVTRDGDINKIVRSDAYEKMHARERCRPTKFGTAILSRPSTGEMERQKNKSESRG